MILNQHHNGYWRGNMNDTEKALQSIVLKAKKYDELTHLYPDGTIHCSFCGKRQEDVKKLIAGNKVYICDECISVCYEILIEENATVTNK